MTDESLEDGHDGWCGCENCAPQPQGEPSDAQIIERLRGQIEEARNAWWSATAQGDSGLIYTDKIEDAMDDIWSAIGHADWTPNQPAVNEQGGIDAMTAEEYLTMSDRAFEGDDDTRATPGENREEQNHG